MNGTWRGMLADERANWDDASPLIAVAPNESALDVEFEWDYGVPNGPPVTIWTEQRVYFPVTYDGREWLDSVPRNPCDEAHRHSGGE